MQWIHSNPRNPLDYPQWYTTTSVYHRLLPIERKVSPFKWSFFFRTFFLFRLLLIVISTLGNVLQHVTKRTNHKKSLK